MDKTTATEILAKDGPASIKFVFSRAEKAMTHQHGG
jgi:hypothetical protein